MLYEAIDTQSCVTMQHFAYNFLSVNLHYWTLFDAHCTCEKELQEFPRCILPYYSFLQSDSTVINNSFQIIKICLVSATCAIGFSDYYSNTLRCCNLIFGTWLRNSFCNLTYSIRFVIRFCSGVSCAHYLVACFLTDAKYSILKDVKIERARENVLVMDLSLYFLRFLRLFDELYRRLFTTFSSISVHTRNVIMYLFTEMSDGSPGRRTFDNPTRYRWLNRKWRTRVYGATKLLGTFATEREPAGMWECVPSLSVFKKSRWERHPRKRPRWFHESRFFSRLLFFLASLSSRVTIEMTDERSRISRLSWLRLITRRIVWVYCLPRRSLW